MCSNALVKDINKQMKQNVALTEIATWAGDKGFSVRRQTLAKHRDHITDPRQTMVEHARRNPEIMNVTPRQAADALLAVGMRNVAREPEQVKVGHVIKLIDIDARRKELNYQHDLESAWGKVFGPERLPGEPLDTKREELTEAEVSAWNAWAGPKNVTPKELASSAVRY